MGHYYHINQVNIEKTRCIFQEELLEWKMELPPMFFPLFFGEAIYINNFLLTPAEEGFKAFERMYNFLEKYKDKVFDNPNEFMEYKPKIIEATIPIADYYLLDASDIFWITAKNEKEILDRHKKQYELLKEINTEIKKSIDDDDIDAFLNIYTDSQITHISQSLKYFFNDEFYKYGYEPFITYESNDEESNVEIFSENDKYGLKKDNKIIVNLIYDDIWNFDNKTNLAVVRLNKKFGYMKEDGSFTIPLLYEDAYDFIYQNEYINNQGWIPKYRAIVKLNDKFGVINLENKTIISFEWEDIEFKEIVFSDSLGSYFFFAKKNNKYCILNFNGKEVYPLTIDEFLVGYNSDEEKEKVVGFQNRLWLKEGNNTFYLNEKFLPFGVNLEIVQDGFTINKFKKNGGYDIVAYNYIAKTKSENYGIIDSNNNIIIPFDYKKITNEEKYILDNIEYFYAQRKNYLDLFSIDKMNKLSKIYSTNDYKEVIQPFEHKILGSYILKIKKNKNWGLYNIKESKFILNPEYLGFYVSSDKSYSLFAFTENSIECYHQHFFTPKTFTINELEQIANHKFDTVNKKIKELINFYILKNKNSSFNKIFSSEKRTYSSTFFFSESKL